MKTLFIVGGIAVGVVLTGMAFGMLLAQCSGLQGWTIALGMVWFALAGRRFLKV